jgi:hypothetical protein
MTENKDKLANFRNRNIKIPLSMIQDSPAALANLGGQAFHWDFTRSKRSDKRTF